MRQHPRRLAIGNVLTVTERVASASDCALLVGIPLSASRFEEAFRRDSGYIARWRVDAGWTARQVSLAWGVYEHDVASTVRIAAERARSLGAGVFFDASLEEVELASSRFHVVTLLAHYYEGDGGLELGSEHVGSPQLAHHIGSEFDGVLDLCTCHSQAMADEIKRLVPRCLVAWNEQPASPRFRAKFYLKTLTLLTKQSYRYTDALFDLRKAFMEAVG